MPEKVGKGRLFGRSEVVEEEAAVFRKQVGNNEKGEQKNRKQKKNQQFIKSKLEESSLTSFTDERKSILTMR